MKYFLAILILLNACQGSNKPANSSVACSGTASPGLLCSNGQWTVASGGYCNSNSDCPPSLYCNTATSQCSKPSSNSNIAPIWFTTDPIQPGINAGGTNGFVYNGMAKGYASLDDWCASQAQQSALLSVRSIRYWTALIIAAPDSAPPPSDCILECLPSSTLVNAASSQAQNRFNWLLQAQTVGYEMPSGQGSYSATNNGIFDKNQNQWIFPVKTNSIFPFASNHNSIWAGMDIPWQNCSISGCTSCPSNPTQSNTYVAMSQAQNQGAWQCSQASCHGGVLVGVPTACSTAFALTSDNMADFFNANGAQAKPILCLGNRRPLD